jgi:hypothetical protein
LTAIVVAYGAPLAYGATLVIVWPAAAVLREAKAFTWWALTLVSALAGGGLFPVYLHALDSRATWDFFPARASPPARRRDGFSGSSRRAADPPVANRTRAVLGRVSDRLVGRARTRKIRVF